MMRIILLSFLMFFRRIRRSRQNASDYGRLNITCAFLSAHELTESVAYNALKFYSFCIIILCKKDKADYVSTEHIVR